jgi:hypothetical protein
MSGYEIRLARPEEEEACWEIESSAWSVFHVEATAEDYYDPALHVVALLDGQLVATGNAVPFPRWDGEEKSLEQIGWGDVQQDWCRLFESGEPPETRFASAIGVSAIPGLRGLGLPLLQALKDAASQAGYQTLAAPVRPTAKWRAPGLPYADYARLRLPDGRHFDPWLRVHERAGGQIVAVCERSFEMRGSRAEWQEWTGLELPESGRLMLEGANEPLLLADGQGSIVEGSVWVLHRLSR